MTRDLHFEFTYPYPPEQVWEALTNPDALSQWLMLNDFKPVVGHRFQFHTIPRAGFSGVVDCVVLEVVPRQRLVYTWTGGGLETRLTWSLEAVSEGTRLTLDHSGFSGLRGMFVSNILGSGWRSRILAKGLPALLANWTGTGAVPDVPEAHCHFEDQVETRETE
jgi:uncharacterized protein YndB with AHSA1/START domain